jgi:hypothetical protein
VVVTATVGADGTAAVVVVVAAACCCCWPQVWAAEGLLYYLEPDSVAAMLKVGSRRSACLVC